jgi:hypothetical protein
MSVSSRSTASQSYPDVLNVFDIFTKIDAHAGTPFHYFSNSSQKTILKVPFAEATDAQKVAFFDLIMSHSEAPHPDDDALKETLEAHPALIANKDQRRSVGRFLDQFFIGFVSSFRFLYIYILCLTTKSVLQVQLRQRQEEVQGIHFSVNLDTLSALLPRGALSSAAEKHVLCNLTPAFKGDDAIMEQVKLFSKWMARGLVAYCNNTHVRRKHSQQIQRQVSSFLLQIKHPLYMYRLHGHLKS